jgi:hypothetical protein
MLMSRRIGLAALAALTSGAVQPQGLDGIYDAIWCQSEFRSELSLELTCPVL